MILLDYILSFFQNEAIQKKYPPTLTGINNKSYEFVKFIAKGGYGTVVKVKEKGGGFYAIKTFLSIQDKDDKEFEMFRKTFHIENVVKAYSMFKTKSETHIVMEFLQGGDLWDNLYEFGPMPRLKAISLFRKLVITIGELLMMGLYPSDLKAENLYHDRKKNNLKILDLGGMKDRTQENEETKEIGTPCFYPPEYHLQEKKQQIEYWEENGELYLSWMLGLILWHMIVGEQKFICSQEDISNFNLDIPTRILGLQGSQTYYLLIQLLAKDPSKRIKFGTLHKKLGISSL